MSQKCGACGCGSGDKKRHHKSCGCEQAPAPDEMNCSKEDCGCCCENCDCGCGCSGGSNECMNCDPIVCCDNSASEGSSRFRICCDPNGYCCKYPCACRNPFWPEFSHPRWLCCKDLYNGGNGTCYHCECCE